MKPLQGKLLIVIISCMTFCISTNVYATNDALKLSEDAADTLKSETDQIKSKNDVEQIEVLATKPLLYYKRQMVKAELDFYDLFNALADEEKYKVKCRREFRAGSRIKNTVCHPQYVLNRMASETQDALNSGGPLPDFKDIEFLVQDEKEESLQYAAKVISKHPELLKKLNVMHQKQEEFKAIKDAG